MQTAPAPRAMAIPEWVSGFVALGTALPTTDFRLPTNGAIPVAVLSYSRKMFPNLPYFQNPKPIPNRTRTRSNTHPNDTKNNAAGRSMRAYVARRSKAAPSFKGGAVSCKSRISAFLYAYRAASLAPRPTSHLGTLTQNRRRNNKEEGQVLGASITSSARHGGARLEQNSGEGLVADRLYPLCFYEFAT